VRTSWRTIQRLHPTQEGDKEDDGDGGGGQCACP